MNPNSTPNGREAVITWNASIHFNEIYTLARLDRGGDRQLPDGFTISPTGDDTQFRLFSDPHDSTVLVPTCAKYGGVLGANGLALKRAMCALIGVGEPVMRRPAEVSGYFDGLMAMVAAFALPAQAMLTRPELEAFIDTDANCQQVVASFTEAVNCTGRLVTDSDLRELIERSTADPAAARLYYANLRDGRMGTSASPVKTARAKRTNTTITSAQEVTSC